MARYKFLYCIVLYKRPRRIYSLRYHPLYVGCSVDVYTITIMYTFTIPHDSVRKYCSNDEFGGIVQNQLQPWFRVKIKLFLKKFRPEPLSSVDRPIFNFRRGSIMK